MWKAILSAGIAMLTVGCGDNLRPGGGEVDAAQVDATTDATPIDALVCPVPAPGTPGGTCTASVECDSAPGAGDGICFSNTGSIAPWPSQGYCLTRAGGCTEDAQCGAGNVCVDLGGGARGCMLGCASAGPCECPDGMICADGYINTPVQRMVCVPGTAAAVDGDRCTTFADCDERSACLADGLEHPGGQCVQLGCTPGDDSTCTSGGDGHCTPADIIPGGQHGCVDTCDVDADCRVADGYRCHDAGGTIGKYCRHGRTGDPCSVDTDCGVASIWECRTGASYPGGYCTIQQPCDAASGAGCSLGSSVCHDPAGPDLPYCVDRCTGTGQGTCRAGYTCQVITGTVRGCV